MYMREITDKLLAEMVEAIVREFSPDRIIVFGSRARGDNSANSDVDLLIVEREPFGPDRSRWEVMTQLWNLVARFRVSADILLYNQEEIEKWRESKNHVISRALSEGKLLYERN